MRPVSSQLAVLYDEESGPGQMADGRGSWHRRDPLARRIVVYVERQPAWLVFGVGVALVALVGWADYVAGDGLSFTPFYLVPAALVTWLLGRKAGIAIALAATVSWSLAYVYAGAGVQWDTVAPYWNIAVQMGIFVVASLILSGFREGLEHEKE